MVECVFEYAYVRVFVPVCVCACVWELHPFPLCQFRNHMQLSLSRGFYLINSFCFFLSLTDDAVARWLVSAAPLSPSPSLVLLFVTLFKRRP